MNGLLEYINVGMMGVGVVIILTALTVVTVRRRWRDAISCRPLRAGRMDMIHVAIVILVFMGLMALMQHLGKSMAPPSGLNEKLWIGSSSAPGLWPVLSNNIAKAVIVLIICVAAALLLDGGLESFGIRTDHLGRDMAWGVLMFFVVLPICMGLAQLIVLFAKQPPMHGVINLVRSPAMPAWGIVSLWISAVLISPVGEEVFFRGMLQTVVRGYVDRPYVAIVVAGIAFGMMHASQPQYVPPLAVLGLLLGYVYEHTGSLVAPILIHVLFNSRTMIFDVLSR
ncbi:MAG: CPBP family intramembrane metalloprotease [Phycisphaerae bacterium]|nr:CPBP family intramembrane metalloprotease [Phycisphaerae bacterium]